MVRNFIITAFFLLIGLASPAHAQDAYTIECNKDETPRLVVTGTGKVEVDPDLALIQVRLFTEEVKLERAYDKNKTGMNQVVELFKKHGVEKKDLQTTEFSVVPQYKDKTMFSKVARPESYSIHQAVSARVEALDAIGSILSDLAEVDGISIGGVQFTLKDSDGARQGALRKAAASARASAIALAEGAGGQLGKILYLEESSSHVPLRLNQSAYFMEKARVDSFMESPAQIEAGTLTIEATCQVTYAVESF